MGKLWLIPPFWFMTKKGREKYGPIVHQINKKPKCNRCNGNKFIMPENPPLNLKISLEVPCPDCNDSNYIKHCNSDCPKWYEEKEVVVVPAVWSHHKSGAADLRCCGKRLATIDHWANSENWYISGVPTKLKINRGPYKTRKHAKKAVNNAFKTKIINHG